MNKGERGGNLEQVKRPELSKDQYKKIKEEFLKPFTSEEMQIESLQPDREKTDSSPAQKQLLHRHLDGFDYVVWMNYEGEGNRVHKLEFQITDQEEKKIANVIFMQDTTHGSSNEWELNHRFIHTEELGISGTEFLQQSEDYAKQLASKELIKFDYASAATSQSNVVNWLNKNGYDFVLPKDRERFEEYKVHPENYEEFYLSDGRASDGEKYDRDPFIFVKEYIDTDELTKYIDPEMNDGKHFIIPHREMLNLRGLLRINVLKKF